ncbi:unnamed protein product, partial [Mesorhabditis belari]|uniref:Uncharacterized protein n=1 Tax=Mesorhabditis belari TaxID=2138241 RepID=A0AAF3FCJ9_9BILA
MHLMHTIAFFFLSILALLVQADLETELPDVAQSEYADGIRSRIAQSARFWGKRDTVKSKVGGSRIFWGKRSLDEPAAEDQIGEDSDMNLLLPIEVQERIPKSVVIKIVMCL